MPSRREAAAVQGFAVLLLSILAVAFLVGQGGVGPSLLDGTLGMLRTNAYLNQSLAVLFLYWVWKYPGHLRKPLGWVIVLLGVGLEIYLDSFRPSPFRLRYPWFGGGLGLAALLPLAAEFKWAHKPGVRFDVTTLLLQPLALIVSAWVSTMLINPFGQSPPRPGYDLYLYHSDLKMVGTLLAAEARRLSTSSEIVLHWMDGIYNYLGLVMGLCQLTYLNKRAKMPCPPTLLFILQGFLVTPIYTLMPATGTVRIFGPKFPNQLPAWVEPQLFQLPAHYPTVCMPSMHTCWGLSCLYLLWPLGGTYRKLACGYAFFLVLSVFSAGNHYLLDAFIALPFTVGSCLLATRMMGQRRPWQMRVALALIASSVTGILFLKNYSIFWSAQPWSLWCLAVSCLILSLAGLRAGHK